MAEAHKNRQVQTLALEPALKRLFLPEGRRIVRRDGAYRFIMLEDFLKSALRDLGSFKHAFKERPHFLRRRRPSETDQQDRCFIFHDSSRAPCPPARSRARPAFLEGPRAPN